MGPSVSPNISSENLNTQAFLSPALLRVERFVQHILSRRFAQHPTVSKGQRLRSTLSSIERALRSSRQFNPVPRDFMRYQLFVTSLIFLSLTHGHQ